jgi:hypothetical protein
MCGGFERNFAIRNFAKFCISAKFHYMSTRFHWNFFYMYIFSNNHTYNNFLLSIKMDTKFML